MRINSFHALCLSILLGLTAHANAGQPAAQVLYVSGDVNVDGQALQKGETVNVGSVMQTGAAGHVYLRAVDGGFLVIRANSKAAFRSYDVENKSEVKIKIELMTGTARSITGNAAKADKDGFRFNTPVAAIGVRGTDFTVQTTETETLVAVSSGGVAVSPLNDTCLASGFGPCKGDFVADLYAGEKGFLRVIKGAAAPELVDKPASAPVVPIPAEVSQKVEQPELSPVYEENLSVLNGRPARSDSSSTVTGPASPLQSGISWGRWEKVANSAPSSELLAEVTGNNGHYGLRFIGPYFLASQADRQYSRPVENQIIFVATGFEAHLGLNPAELRPATVTDANLTVNFNDRQFNTAFTVVNSIGELNVRSTGLVGPTGNLEGGIVGSNAKVVGYLEGGGATHASTIFNTFGGGQYSAAGFVQWAR